MRGGSDNVQAWQSGSTGDFFSQCSQLRTRIHNVTEHLSRDIQLTQQVESPVAGRRVKHLRRCRIRKFNDTASGKQPVEEVRDHQKSLGLFHQRTIRLVHGNELVQRIDFHELKAGLRKNLAPGNSLKGLFKYSLRSAVAVMIGLPQHLTGLGKEYKIDSPCIDAYRNDVLSEPSRRLCQP